MNRITRQQMLMEMAITVSKRSTCSRAQVGCVVSHDGRIISTGYNGSPKGMQHCHHQPDELHGCTESVHAEANAISFAAKHGVSTNGATIHTTLSPCPTCAMLIINSGIVKVIYRHKYRLGAGIDLLLNGGIECKGAWEE